VSNVVSTRVLAVFGIELTPEGTVAAPAHSLTGAPGDTSYCHLVLENRGNVRDSLAVSAGVIAPSTLTPVALITFHDANGNGRVDPGEDDPTLFALDPGDTLGVGVGIVLPPVPASGEIYLEVTAASWFDPVNAVDTSVLHAYMNTPLPGTLYLGPAGNPRAAPGGGGSGDDVTLGSIGYDDVAFTFENDLLNDAPYPQVVELILPDVSALAPGVELTVLDSTGASMVVSQPGGGHFLIGTVPAGETTRFQVRVASAAGTPLFKLSPSALSLDLTARAVADTSQSDTTLDRLVPPQEYNPLAVIALRQTFHETVAAAGDVVTLVVTVENVTDSLRVDGIEVSERVDPQLDFAGSPDFEWNGGVMRWRAGSLAGGESRTGVVKFVANTRVAQGRARAVAGAAGRAESGDDGSAGPVASAIRIDNDIFGAEGVILGDVFVDADADGRRSAREAGVPGVAVFLDSGEFAVSDSCGVSHGAARRGQPAAGHTPAGGARGPAPRRTPGAPPARRPRAGIVRAGGVAARRDRPPHGHHRRVVPGEGQRARARTRTTARESHRRVLRARQGGALLRHRCFPRARRRVFGRAPGLGPSRRGAHGFAAHPHRGLPVERRAVDRARRGGARLGRVARLRPRARGRARLRRFAPGREQ
jgi:hypothetical protein